MHILVISQEYSTHIPAQPYLGHMRGSRVSTWTTKQIRLCQAELFPGIRLVASIVSIRRTTPWDGHPSRYWHTYLLLIYKYRFATLPFNFFFVWAKMGDIYKIWRETGQLASCCTSIYKILSIWFTDSLNICKILFSEIPDTLIICESNWKKTINRSATRGQLANLSPNFVDVTHFCLYQKKIKWMGTPLNFPHHLPWLEKFKMWY